MFDRSMSDTVFGGGGFAHIGFRRSWALVGIALVSCGCTSLGPQYIEASRGSYLDVLALTDQEELLANLVRIRYAEAPVFMQVDGITASPTLSFQLEAEIDTGSPGDESTLKPRVTYEDKPTIVYTPLLGKEFSRELLVPLDPIVLLLLHENGWQLDELMRLLVSSVNGVRNHPDEAVQFNAIADAFGVLSQNSGLILGTGDRAAADTDRTMSFRLSSSAKASDAGRFLIAELGLDETADVYAVESGFRSEAPIAITMRPLYAIMSRLADMIDVPAEHHALATASEQHGGNQLDRLQLIRIQSSPARPADAVVSIRSRGVWFSIADSDLQSKRTLQTLRLLFNLQAQKGGGTAFQLSLPVR